MSSLLRPRTSRWCTLAPGLLALGLSAGGCGAPVGAVRAPDAGVATEPLAEDTRSTSPEAADARTEGPRAPDPSAPHRSDPDPRPHAPAPEGPTPADPDDPDAFLDAFPPGGTHGSSADGLFVGEFRGTLATDTRDREVVLRWSWDPTGSFHRDTVRARGSESLRCAFRPNAITAVGDDRALVAGLDEATGEVVVELWPLSPPRVLDDGDPAGATLRPRPHGPRRRVLARPADACGPVALLVQNQRLPDRAFVLFSGTRTLEALDWSRLPATTHVVARPDDPAPAGVLVCPELADPEYDGAWSGVLADPSLRDVYVFRDRSRMNLSPPILWLDPNQDGRIDAFRVVPVGSAEWERLALHDAARFVSRQGR